MLDPKERFFAYQGAVTPDGPTIWYITDWDQRRTIGVRMDGEIEDENVCIEHLRPYADGLAPEVLQIYVSPQGDLLSVSSNPEDDVTGCSFCPDVDDILRLIDVPTVSRSSLEEIGRLGPMVDLVKCCDGIGPLKKVSSTFNNSTL